MEFRKIDPKELPGNVCRMFDDGWALLTAGAPDAFNTMTVSWGCIGWLWNRPVCIGYVRESRYTYQFTEENDYFTVSFFEPGEYRRELGVLGAKSGRDMDKIHQSGLTPVTLDGQVAFGEATAVLVCRKLYTDMIDPANMLTPDVAAKHYGDGDFHRAYTAEIVSAYVKD